MARNSTSDNGLPLRFAAPISRDRDASLPRLQPQAGTKEVQPPWRPPHGNIHVQQRRTPSLTPEARATSGVLPARADGGRNECGTALKMKHLAWPRRLRWGRRSGTLTFQARQAGPRRPNGWLGGKWTDNIKGARSHPGAALRANDGSLLAGVEWR